MDEACSAHGGDHKCVLTLLENHDAGRSLGRPMRKQEDNIKTDTRFTWWGQKTGNFATYLSVLLAS